ncbi:unnamed protein product [Lymnaea stagnalis]|uniref:Cilia- and flagella-associated protein 70 n=1 Tax=Lymnaea stagnalis TaxID=6523 RepID=A0AAV2HAU0_LYMST
MTEAESSHFRGPEPVCITLERVKHMRGSRSEGATVFIKFELGERLLGESPKIECTPDVSAESNFNTFLNIIYDDPSCLDEITNRPVVLTVIEVLPKEKRQKEERTITLGQCCLDFNCFILLGCTKLKQTLQILPVPGSPLDNLPPDITKVILYLIFQPEVDIKISVNQPLLDEAQLQGSNILTISVGGLLSPPESWATTGPQFTYSASISVPISEEKDATVVFTNGALKPAQDKDAHNKQKKWANPGTAVGQAVFLPDSYLFSDPIDEEDGDLKSKEDREHRIIAETEKLHVTWNMERRCYLNPSAVKVFQESIGRCRYWPLEVMRYPVPVVSKSKKNSQATLLFAADEENAASFHGVAFLNLAPLLYPGVQRIKGAFKVVAFTDNVVSDKIKRKTMISDDGVKQAPAVLSRTVNSPIAKKSMKEGEKKDQKKRPGSLVPPSSEAEIIGKASDLMNDTDSQQSMKLDAVQYIEAKSYVMIEISLDKPLVPKRPPEALAKRVAELIPPRLAFPKRTDGAQKAVEDYHSQIASVANIILEEFRDLFGDQVKDNETQSVEDMEARKQKLVYELNSSGKYFAFKEQLKNSVVKIVREKYLRTSGFDDRQELQTFLSELYVYLIDQMHVSLGHVLSLEDQPPIPKPLTDLAQLKHFAREAEVNQNFNLAETFYKERIAREKNNADCWFDYGIFNLYIHDISKAEECFKECISIDQKHMNGLILYGIVCTLTERNELAETFFEAATCVDPNSILAWTMLGLFYEGVPNEIRAEMAFIEADKLNFAKLIALKEEEDKRKAEEEANRIMADSTDAQSQEISEQEMITEGKIMSPVDKNLTPDLIKTTSSEKRGSIAKASLNKTPIVSRPVSTFMSTVQPVMSETESKTVSSRESLLPEGTSIYMQAVDWLLEVKATPFTERALGHELVTSPGSPTSAYQLALARLKLQKGDYAEAEQTLNETIQTDFQASFSRNPDAWSLLGHVKYLTNDHITARDCYERTLAFVNDASETHSIYLRLASIYLQEEKYQNAKDTFLKACKRSPSCISWLGVGIACYRLNELSEAEDALSEANVLNNNDPEVWAYLSLVCLKTNRRLEAEQAYKYAIKLNLDDGPLLAEIHREQVARGFGNPSF